ncbi:MAG: hypothetical protein ACRD5I_14740, partial [Candidatus Acidiferrales bacterium]
TVESKLPGLDPTRVRQVVIYRDDFCKPWLHVWDKAMAPCDKDRPPSWCEDEEAISSRVNLGAYFAAMTSILGATSDGLARYNIMAVIVNATTPHVITA